MVPNTDTLDAPNTSGIYYPLTTEEVFEKWEDPNAHSTMQRIFGSVAACEEACLAIDGELTSKAVENLPGFKAFCSSQPHADTNIRDALAARIVEEMKELAKRRSDGRFGLA